MKIIQVHNYYQQAGGEDGVVASELELLRGSGNEVVTYYKGNEALGVGRWALLVKASVQTLWNRKTYREFRKLLKTEKPDVVHCHNTFPLISPSIYWVCAKEGVPVVQTLHNYRLLCLNAFLFRGAKKGREALGIRHEGNDCGSTGEKYLTPSAQCQAPSPTGSICEKCLTKSFKRPGIRYGCYRDSKAGSLVVALMLLFHKIIGTWSKKVTAYIALTEFQKQKMIEGGLPADKIWVKPNFIQRTEDGCQRTDAEVQKVDENTLTADVRALISGQTPFALFVGRLSPEKGCDVLIRAWALFEQQSSDLGSPTSENQKPVLLIVGDGPERATLEHLSLDLCPLASVHFLGKQPKESVLSLMCNAQFLVLPSVWYEGFPMTIVEAFSCGTAVVASDDGGMSEIIMETKNGLKFGMGDELQLTNQMAWAFKNPEKMAVMGRAARADFETKYSAEVNYSKLMEIYELASC
jgi:glycosyltransferase involved in cell wall biosynthesis